MKNKEIKTIENHEKKPISAEIVASADSHLDYHWLLNNGGIEASKIDEILKSA